MNKCLIGEIAIRLMIKIRETIFLNLVNLNTLTNINCTDLFNGNFSNQYAQT